MNFSSLTSALSVGRRLHLYGSGDEPLFSVSHPSISCSTTASATVLFYQAVVALRFMTYNDSLKQGYSSGSPALPRLHRQSDH